MTRFLFLPVLLAAASFGYTIPDLVEPTDAWDDAWASVEVSYEPFVFDGLTIDSAPVCRVDLLEAAEDAHTREAIIVLREDFQPAC
jgi:hypothetical protein